MRVHAAIVPRGMHADPSQRPASELAVVGIGLSANIAAPTRARPGARAKMPDSNSLLN
jgi:hypothetical protein